jgi:hypothetical protein
MLTIRSIKSELIVQGTNSTAAWMVLWGAFDSLVNVELSIELIAKRRITNVQLERNVSTFTNDNESKGRSQEIE